MHKSQLQITSQGVSLCLPWVLSRCPSATLRPPKGTQLAETVTLRGKQMTGGDLCAEAILPKWMRTQTHPPGLCGWALVGVGVQEELTLPW